MRAQQIREELDSPELAKFKPYLNSFFTLTESERKRVLSKHPKFRHYMELFYKEMAILRDKLSLIMSVGNDMSQGEALQVESLDVVLKKVTFSSPVTP